MDSITLGVFHAWTAETLKALGSCLGHVIDIDEKPAPRSVVEIAGVCILCTQLSQTFIMIRWRSFWDQSGFRKSKRIESSVCQKSDFQGKFQFLGRRKCWYGLRRDAIKERGKDLDDIPCKMMFQQLEMLLSDKKEIISGVVPECSQWSSLPDSGYGKNLFGREEENYSWEAWSKSVKWYECQQQEY